MSKLSDLISQVEKKDPALADELRKEVSEYAKRRPFGLNFERHQPENVRLYGRKARRGDLVNILPERGKSEKAENKRLWRVVSTDGNSAQLNSIGDDIPVERIAEIENLVVLSEFNQPIYPGLEETGRVERGGDKPYQVVINGENYHALETLLYAYEGKVDCIYIDPPYNTGAKDWKYNNDYVDSADYYRHSKWLAMMERRLRLAKRLLNKDNSILIVTIDEKEVSRLALLLEQLFPPDSIQMVTSVISAKGAVRDGQFSRVEEHIFFISIGSGSILQQKENMLDSYIEHNADSPIEWLGLRRREPSSVRGARPNQFYPIFVNNEDGLICGVGDQLPDESDRQDIDVPEGATALWPLNKDGDERLWGLTYEVCRKNWKLGYVKVTSWNKTKHTGTVKYLPGGTIQDLDEGTAVRTGVDRDGSVTGYYPGEAETTTPPKRVWNKASHNAETFGTNIISALIPGRRFDYPKSLYAVEDSLRFAIGNNPNAIIVDFFSGSGTTAHATMRLNHQDNGCRRCICITNNEISSQDDKKLTKGGFRPGDSEWEALGICEFYTKPRIEAAITGLTPDKRPVAGSYGVEHEVVIEDSEDEIISKRTGRPIHNRKIYIKQKQLDPSVPDSFPMADGFEENAVFYKLTYQDELAVALDTAFEEISPILWMRAGSKGRCIKKPNGTFDIAETYAVLFNYRNAKAFLDELTNHKDVKLVYIVTDQESAFQDIVRQLPEEIETVRLYESYIRSFKINQGEA